MGLSEPKWGITHAAVRAVKPNPVSSPQSAVDECSRRAMCHEHGGIPYYGFQRRGEVCIDESAKTEGYAGVG